MRAIASASSTSTWPTRSSSRHRVVERLRARRPPAPGAPRRGSRPAPPAAVTSTCPTRLERRRVDGDELAARDVRAGAHGRIVAPAARRGARPLELGELAVRPRVEIVRADVARGSRRARRGARPTAGRARARAPPPAPRRRADRRRRPSRRAPRRRPPRARGRARRPRALTSGASFATRLSPSITGLTSRTSYSTYAATDERKSSRTTSETGSQPGRPNRSLTAAAARSTRRR